MKWSCLIFVFLGLACISNNIIAAKFDMSDVKAMTKDAVSIGSSKVATTNTVADLDLTNDKQNEGIKKEVDKINKKSVADIDTEAERAKEKVTLGQGEWGYLGEVYKNKREKGSDVLPVMISSTERFLENLFDDEDLNCKEVLEEGQSPRVIKQKVRTKMIEDGVPVFHECEHLTNKYKCKEILKPECSNTKMALNRSFFTLRQLQRYGYNFNYNNSNGIFTLDTKSGHGGWGHNRYQIYVDFQIDDVEFIKQFRLQRAHWSGGTVQIRINDRQIGEVKTTLGAIDCKRFLKAGSNRIDILFISRSTAHRGEFCLLCTNANATFKMELTGKGKCVDKWEEVCTHYDL